MIFSYMVTTGNLQWYHLLASVQPKSKLVLNTILLTLDLMVQMDEGNLICGRSYEKCTDWMP